MLLSCLDKTDNKSNTISCVQNVFFQATLLSKISLKSCTWFMPCPSTRPKRFWIISNCMSKKRIFATGYWAIQYTYMRIEYWIFGLVFFCFILRKVNIWVFVCIIKYTEMFKLDVNFQCTQFLFKCTQIF